uniref:Uncharacterized protein n=1 Tax=Panagrolaimus sp. PS1159 TaxID=55785 RepID=A0AC35FQT0_9BILA
MSRRFSKYMHRAKRNVFFEDSKDHQFKEKQFKIITKNQLNNLSPQQKSDNPIISSITNVIREFTSENSENKEEEKGNEHLKWTKTYNRLMKVRKAIDEQKRVPGAKVYEHRMYDLVLERDEPSLSPSERRSPQGILHESMKLLGDLTAKSNGSAPYTRLFSPRFMPLMPLNEGKRQPETYLSPTIMAMYDEPNKTNEVIVGNVPKTMNALGVTKKDQGKIMQLLMDFTKTNTYIDESLKIYEVLGMFDEDIGEPILSATEKIMGSFKNLEKGLFLNQKEALENQGFAFLKKEQMQTVLKDQEIPEGEIDLADFDIYDKMSDEEMEISLWKTIENIANNKTNVLRPSETHIRQKRDKICFVCPTVLSPLLFTVQTGILIIGPLVISPTAFAPPILNPSIMAPWLMSPGIFDPLILSPYILTPFILGPLAFTPFILTPYFLSPNVLNPYVITSLILSPIGLSPDVLSPQFIGATILSPSVLSPPILNPTLYTTSAFSPSFLS